MLPMLSTQPFPPRNFKFIPTFASGGFLTVSTFISPLTDGSEEEEEEEEEETEEEEEESEDDYVIKNAGQIVSTKLLEWNEPIVTSFENESLSTEELCSDDDSLESISQQYLPTEFAAYRVKNNLFRCNDHMYEEEEEEEEEEMYSDEDAQECSSSETSDTQNNECKL